MGTNSTRSTVVTTTPTLESEWQRIWFGLRQRDWTSVAIVPSHAGVDVAKVADTLAEMGRLEGEHPVTVIPALGVQLAEMSRITDAVGEATARGQLVLVPVDPVADNPSTIGILRATSAAMLVVRLGESDLSVTRSVVDAIGRDRLLGSVVLETSDPPAR